MRKIAFARIACDRTRKRDVAAITGIAPMGVTTVDCVFAVGFNESDHTAGHRSIAPDTIYEGACFYPCSGINRAHARLKPSIASQPRFRGSDIGGLFRARFPAVFQAMPFLFDSSYAR